MYKKYLIAGWREWLALPNWGIKAIKAKVDTGARTSALHASGTHVFKRDGKDWVRFTVYPLQRRTDVTIVCEAEINDRRWVTDSGGHKELRYVVTTLLTLGDKSWPIEITLTNRDTMSFRMLLGRSAMRRHLIVNPSASYLTKK